MKLSTTALLFGTLLTAFPAVRSAQATPTSIVLEAEAARYSIGGRITTPLLIRDDDLASGGSYIEVIPGNNSQSAMPATEGVVDLFFDQPDPSATFTIWARVIAPSTSHDSFWVSMDNGPAIAWNNIQLGTSWHWVQVKDQSATLPATFTLGPGSHTLAIAYREDGTKLDQLIITSDATFNPNAILPPTPAAPVLDNNYPASWNAGTLLSWSETPGAVLYTLKQMLGSTPDGNDPVISVGHGHTRVVTGSSGSFYVVATFLNGSTTSNIESLSSTSYFQDAYHGSGDMSITPPMDSSLSVASGTPSSFNSAPAHGRGRYDFRVAVPVDINVFALVGAPSLSMDSYWVRVDQGAWVKWNNIANGVCSRVRNSDAGEVVMKYSLGVGSHFVEFAYREAGASLGKFALMAASGTNLDACND